MRVLITLLCLGAIVLIVLLAGFPVQAAEKPVLSSLSHYTMYTGGQTILRLYGRGLANCFILVNGKVQTTIIVSDTESRVALQYAEPQVLRVQVMNKEGMSEAVILRVISPETKLASR